MRDTGMTFERDLADTRLFQDHDQDFDEPIEVLSKGKYAEQRDVSDSDF